MNPPAVLRIVIVAPETLAPDPADPAAAVEAERSRSLRIGLLETRTHSTVARVTHDVDEAVLEFLYTRHGDVQPAAA